MLSIRRQIPTLLAVGLLGAGGAEADPDAGASVPANAFANQQIFAWICSTTVGIGAAADPGGCGWGVFGPAPSPAQPLAALLRVVSENLMDLAFGLPVSPPVPLARLNRDPLQSFVPYPTTHTLFIRGELLGLVNSVRQLTGVGPLPTGPMLDGMPTGVVVSTCTRSSGAARVLRHYPDFFGNANNDALVHLFLPDLRPALPGICSPLGAEGAPDTLTLGSSLSSFQKALLGCRASFGERCDGSDPVQILLLPQGSVASSVAELNTRIRSLSLERDGIDFPDAEASVLQQAWPGRTDSWTTTGQGQQPGTAEVVEMSAPFEPSLDAGSHCAVPDGQGGLAVLPGCRGIESVLVTRDPSSLAVVSVQIAFEDGYRPSLDGCLVGGSVAADAPPEVIGRLGANLFTGEGGVDVTLVANPHGYLPDAQEIRRCHTESGEVGDFSPLPVSGSNWLWHPLAGCLSDDRAGKVLNFGTDNIDPDTDPHTDARFGDCGTIMVNGVPTNRTFLDRFKDSNQDGVLDIEEEFLGRLERADCVEGVDGYCEPVSVSTAQLFPNEIAALSWNYLQFLVATSCSGVPEAERRGDPQCFVPEQAWRADRCSFNAPQLCSEVLAIRERPLAVTIRIQSKPGRGFVHSSRMVGVDVLGSERVDVRDIDLASLGFGPEGVPPLRHRERYGDLNRDGHLDLTTWYWVRESDVRNAELCLDGSIAGFPFRGCETPQRQSRSFGRSGFVWGGD